MYKLSKYAVKELKFNEHLVLIMKLDAQRNKR